MTALLIGPDERTALIELTAMAAANPVYMPALVKRLDTAAGKAAHMGQMTRQSVDLPGGWCVTFSIEQGHPIGDCRHMSMSLDKPGRVPNQHAVWMVAEVLGFWGSLVQCDMIWQEKLQGHGEAVNVVQRIDRGTVQ